MQEVKYTLKHNIAYFETFIYNVQRTFLRQPYRTKDVFETFITYKGRLRNIHNVQRTSLKHSYHTKDVFETFITYKIRL